MGEDSPIPNVRGIRTDIVEAMKAIRVPNIRWPGGCFADDYHWMDGIGPKAERTPIVNVHWGGVLENNHFGTHEFMDLCEQIGCEPYICGNVGSGTVREMRDWIEYLTDDGQSPMAQLRRKNGRDKAWDITMFGVGNENWGCGGFMTAAAVCPGIPQIRDLCTQLQGDGENQLVAGAGDPAHCRRRECGTYRMDGNPDAVRTASV